MGEYDWTDKWPESVGTYWFLGWLWGVDSWGERPGPGLHSVRVYQGANALMCVSDRGSFMYKNEAVGIWIRAILPNYKEDRAQSLLQSAVSSAVQRNERVDNPENEVGE